MFPDIFSYQTLIPYTCYSNKFERHFYVTGRSFSFLNSVSLFPPTFCFYKTKKNSEHYCFMYLAGEVIIINNCKHLWIVNQR